MAERLGVPIGGDGPEPVHLQPGDIGYWCPSPECLAEIKALEDAWRAGIIELMRNPPLVD